MNDQEKSNLINASQGLIKNTEDDITRELFRSLLSHSKSWDNFSSWILLISGSTFALIIPNLNSLKNLVSPINMQWILLLLLISSFFGVIAKYFSKLIEGLFGVTSTLENQLPIVIKKYKKEKNKIDNLAQKNNVNIKTDIDLKKVMQTIVNQFPKIYHKFMWNSFEQGKKDVLLNYKKTTRLVLRRGFYITMQIVFLVASIFILAANIKNI
ncbi:MAG: hypothetical protein K9L80_01535 [Candidatus Omnitrophica bacterium]|nr:hypothetical protein [Candidatus Omnitrophota bacterium]MCF7916950.1 hypothetical protein [Candidatus Omnitrophota bacterium]